MGILESRLSGMKHESSISASEDKKSEKDIKIRFEENNRDETSTVDKSILTEEDIKSLDSIKEMMSEENFIRDEKRKKKRRRISQAILTLACTYMVVLIYGSFITEFYYNDRGELAPIEMSVSDITNMNEFNSILGMYFQARSLYEELLVFDYRVASGIEDTLNIAPEYEAALDTVSTLTVQIEAATINSKYNQVRYMILTWVKTHAAAYCQFMSSAITQNDSNAANEAIAARQVVNDQFQTITQNIVTLADEIKGIEVDSIKNWSPDGFIQQTIEGVDNETNG